VEDRGYRILVSYTSQLPILERRIPLSSFHDGFEANYNRQQYVSATIEGHTVSINFAPDLRQLHDLENQTIDMDISDLVEFHDFRTTSVRLDVGAGPSPAGGGTAVFFSAQVDFAAGANIEQDVDFNIDFPSFSIVARFFLVGAGNAVVYVPKIEAELFFDKINDILGAEGEEKKAELEQKLRDLQFKGGNSRSSAFVKTWLVGGRRQLVSLAYAAGPGDIPRPDGIVEPATGDLIVRYVGPKPKPSAVSVLQDPTGGSSSPPLDDGSVRLFDLPDEEPDPKPADGGGLSGGGLAPVGSGGGP
jgi:hypothetical protein